jgi:hypothetical protein
MFAASKTSTPSGGGPDPQFNYVTMLLHGDGTNGAQNNTFLDSSTNNFTITRNGNTTQGSFSPYGSNWGVYFGGVGNYLTTATSASGFSFGTGDFTIEFWINSNQTTRCDPIGQDNTFSSSGWWGLVFNRSSNNTMEWFENTNSRISATSVTWNNGQWNHVAVTRNGNSVRMFLNGTQVGSTYTTSFTYGASSVGIINGVISDGKTDGPLTGYLSNVRIVKGTAVYTSSFTPSTTPLTAISGTSLLTNQSNRFIDNSSNALAITTTGTLSVQRFNPFGASTAYSTSVIGGSGYFDGTDDNLSYSQQTYSGDFTFECWVYQTGASGSYALVFASNTASVQIMIDYQGTGKLTFYSNSSSIQSASNVFQRNQWNHLAYVRSGSTVTIYYNGTSVASGTQSNAIPISFIGGYSSSGYTLNGYMSDARITTSALYTTTFTPPTAPLTAISGTSLLLNYTNGAIFDNAMMNDLETVGNAQISTSVVKYGTGSLAFDGNGDYLSTRATPNLSFNSGNFTIECWVYANALGPYNAVFAQWPDNGGTTNNSYTLESVGSSMDFYWVSAAGLHGPATLGTITTGVWIHYAICRSGNTLYAFKNGVLGTTTSITQTLNTSTSNVTIGGAVAGGGDWIGYIDDLRITKGYARYTTNFTPPTQAYPNTGPY